MATRLDSIAPDLVAALAAAPGEARNEAAWKAACWAVERVGLSHPVVFEALTNKQVGKVPSVVSELDERYFQLQDGDASQMDILSAFGKARAASAIEFALCGKPVDAVYEAAIATDDLPKLRSVIETSLRLDLA